MNSASCLIVGAGKLGKRVGELLVSSGTAVTAETSTTQTHSELQRLGMKPRTRNFEGEFDSVLFSIPPSSNYPYHAELQRALALWNHKGSFVFISSTSVYSEENGGVVNEASSLSKSPRAAFLIEAENLSLQQHGVILRLAGLYDKISGPHLYYASQKESPLRGDGIINLIHYDDAAKMSFKLLCHSSNRKIFLGSDNSPITRHALASIWAQKVNLVDTCQFTGTDGPVGKCVDSSLSRGLLNFTLKYPSFYHFVSNLIPEKF